MPVYLFRKEANGVKELKNTIKEDYGFSIPMTEIIRDSLKIFLENMEREEALNDYLKSKGWI
ncbi:MAG: hypothetical protein Q7U77_15260 [Sediminibacterium sp.]|uniref:hypothetical protein n=1 Tax=Sediminibacterium sp. TaxID=1917865 RepID=UPI00271957AB|nr:hypothetical protein [Sediminibacterium sp.]MDO8997978.1 hypothetical protein [Sediminibacterium sp.]